MRGGAYGCSFSLLTASVFSIEFLLISSMTVCTSEFQEQVETDHPNAKIQFGRGSTLQPPAISGLDVPVQLRIGQKLQNVARPAPCQHRIGFHGRLRPAQYLAGQHTLEC